jgi:hypothetical protein
MKKLSLVILVGFMFIDMFCFGRETERKKIVYKKLSFSAEYAVENLTTQQMQRDIDMLEYLIQTCYVNYITIQNGHYFDFGKALQKIRAQCEINGTMSNSDFIKLIADSLAGWPDCHVLLGKANSEKGYYVKNHNDFYDTDIVVDHNGKNFTVVSSLCKNVQAGWHYLSDSHYLLPAYSERGKMWKIGTLSSQKIVSLQIKFCDSDGNMHIEEIPVHQWKMKSETDFACWMKETPEQAYIRVNNFEQYNSEGLAAFVNFADSAKQKKLLILDIRNNPGGASLYPYEFVYKLCGLNFPKVTSTGSNSTKRHSLKTIIMWSPGICQSWLSYYNSLQLPLSPYSMSEINKIEEKDRRLKNKPERYLEIMGDSTFPKDFFKKELSRFSGRIIVITNRETESAAEDLCFLLKNGTNVERVGENTKGARACGNVRKYILPYSKCLISLPSARFATADKPVDDGNGFIPDYWVSSDEELYRVLYKMGAAGNFLDKIKNMDTLVR